MVGHYRGRSTPRWHDCRIILIGGTALWQSYHPLRFQVHIQGLPDTNFGWNGGHHMTLRNDFPLFD